MPLFIAAEGEHPTFFHKHSTGGQAAIGEAATEMPESGDLHGNHRMKTLTPGMWAAAYFMVSKDQDGA